MAGGGRGAGADHATANTLPTNLIMMKVGHCSLDLYFVLVLIRVLKFWGVQWLSIHTCSPA